MNEKGIRRILFSVSLCQRLWKWLTAVALGALTKVPSLLLGSYPANTP